MTDSEIKFATEMAEHQFQDLPKNVFDIMHRPSFIAGFVRAIAVSKEALKSITLSRTAWIYCKDGLPIKTGRYRVAQLDGRGNRQVTTRKFYAKSKCWAEGRWETGKNVYAWMECCAPDLEVHSENT